MNRGRAMAGSTDPLFALIYHALRGDPAWTAGELIAAWGPDALRRALDLEIIARQEGRPAALAFWQLVCMAVIRAYPADAMEAA